MTKNEIWVIRATLNGTSSIYLFETEWSAIGFMNAFDRDITVEKWKQEVNH